MPRVVHFEIPVENPERTVKFYTDVFGWQVQKWQGPEEYWLISTGPKQEPGIDGGFFLPKGPMTGAVNTLDVPSIDEFLAKVAQTGGTVVVPKRAIPGVGYQAYCKDPEGNLFGIHQADPSAK